jgi:starch phosphorylase
MSSDHIDIRTGLTVEALKQAFLDNLYYLRGKDRAFATNHDNYVALAYTIRDRLVRRRQATSLACIKANAKTVYYLSAEYLMGRQLKRNLLSLEATELARQVLAELGLDLDDLVEVEPEPGLGNGGLARLLA